jgi:hypothetical protein
MRARAHTHTHTHTQITASDTERRMAIISNAFTPPKPRRDEPVQACTFCERLVSEIHDTEDAWIRFMDSRLLDQLYPVRGGGLVVGGCGSLVVVGGWWLWVVGGNWWSMEVAGGWQLWVVSGCGWVAVVGRWW